MEITSNSGIYKVYFDKLKINQIFSLLDIDDFVLIDRKVAILYSVDLVELLKLNKIYLIDAHENSKAYDAFGDVYEFLLKNNLRKKSRIFAIGGGIIQDIACFISSTIYRGVEWIYIPTTLLSQCDSCIGSKSSVNFKHMKNVIGNFYPPREIYIISNFLLTLTDQEIKSGLGEIFKVSVIDGLDSFFEFSNNYDGLLMNRNLLSKYIKYALKVKKEYIEIDEYDRGVRNIFNYGHSFGHAIESASDFLIPHGIAVSIGMDIANFISLKYGFLDYDLLNKMHTPLLKNYIKYRDQMPKTSAMIKAISSDKKNTFKNFSLILLGADNKLSKVEVKNDNFFADNLNLALEYIDHE